MAQHVPAPFGAFCARCGTTALEQMGNPTAPCVPGRMSSRALQVSCSSCGEQMAIDEWDAHVTEHATEHATAPGQHDACALCGGEVGPDVTGRPMCYDCGPADMLPREVQERLRPAPSWAEIEARATRLLSAPNEFLDELLQTANHVLPIHPGDTAESGPGLAARSDLKPGVQRRHYSGRR